MGGGDHRCEWREQAESLAEKLGHAARAMDAAEKIIAAKDELLAQQGALIEKQSEIVAKQGEQLGQLQATVDKLQRHIFGKRSEKITPLERAIRDPARAEEDRIAALQIRRENLEAKRQLATRTIEHEVPEADRTCPKCGGHDFTPLGDGLETEMYELVPATV